MWWWGGGCEQGDAGGWVCTRAAPREHACEHKRCAGTSACTLVSTTPCALTALGTLVSARVCAVGSAGAFTLICTSTCTVTRPTRCAGTPVHNREHKPVHKHKHDPMHNPNPVR